MAAPRAPATALARSFLHSLLAAPAGSAAGGSRGLRGGAAAAAAAARSPDPRYGERPPGSVAAHAAPRWALGAAPRADAAAAAAAPLAGIAQRRLEILRVANFVATSNAGGALRRAHVEKLREYAAEFDRSIDRAAVIVRNALGRGHGAGAAAATPDRRLKIKSLSCEVADVRCARGFDVPLLMKVVASLCKADLAAANGADTLKIYVNAVAKRIMFEFGEVSEQRGGLLAMTPVMRERALRHFNAFVAGLTTQKFECNQSLEKALHTFLCEIIKNKPNILNEANNPTVALLGELRWNLLCWRFVTGGPAHTFSRLFAEIDAAAIAEFRKHIEAAPDPELKLARCVERATAFKSKQILGKAPLKWLLGEFAPEDGPMEVKLLGLAATPKSHAIEKLERARSMCSIDWLRRRSASDIATVLKAGALVGWVDAALAEAVTALPQVQAAAEANDLLVFAHTLCEFPFDDSAARLRAFVEKTHGCAAGFAVRSRARAQYVLEIHADLPRHFPATPAPALPAAWVEEAARVELRAPGRFAPLTEHLRRTLPRPPFEHISRDVRVGPYLVPVHDRAKKIAFDFASINDESSRALRQKHLAERGYRISAVPVLDADVAPPQSFAPEAAAEGGQEGAL